jgi:deoxyribonuclease V
MIACLDVDYRDDQGVAGCVLFHNWPDEHSQAQLVEVIQPVQPYQPGQFYRRELPCLLAVLSKVTDPLTAILIDGYVWLHDEHTPGLGGHLHAALGRGTPVIGVAKTRFASAGAAVAVLRGGSQQPLYVTAAGMEPVLAARHVQRMHGPYRLPTMLRLVDQLCRQFK